MNDLRDRVRAERKKLGLTQEQLAKRAGVSVRAYQDFEQGKRKPQPDNLRAILAAVEFSNGAEPGDVPQQTLNAWPDDVQVFLDVMGVYLVSLDADERLQVMRDLTRQVFRKGLSGAP